MVRPTRAQQASTRNDDYMSAASLLGGRRDPSNSLRIKHTSPLQQTELNQLYLSCGLSRRIIDLPAEDMTRAGFALDNIENPRAILSQLESLSFTKVATDALRWKFLFGGVGIIMLVDDGGTLEDPLNDDQPRDIESFRVVDRFRIQWDATDINQDPDSADFGKVERYRIQPQQGGHYYVHADRIHIIDGLPLPDDVRQLNNGWGASSLQFCQSEVRRLVSSWQWASHLIERAQQAVHKIPDLSKYTRTAEGADAAARRADLVDMSRNLLNTVVIDGAEEYDLKSSSFSGVTDIIDRMAEALCAVTGRPMTLLLGRAPAGMNSTGKSDLELWNANILRMSEQDYKPLIEKVVRIIAGPKVDFAIKFNSLFVPTEKETAETNRQTAEERRIYAELGWLSSSEGREQLIADGWELDGDLAPEAVDYE